MKVRRCTRWSKLAVLTGTLLLVAGCVPPQSPPQAPQETGQSSSAPVDSSSNTTQADDTEAPGEGGGY